MSFRLRIIHILFSFLMVGFLPSFADGWKYLSLGNSADSVKPIFPLSPSLKITFADGEMILDDGVSKKEVSQDLFPSLSFYRKASMEIKVRPEYDGYDLSNIRVTIRDAENQDSEKLYFSTDANGDAIVDDLAPGSYIVSIDRAFGLAFVRDSLVSHSIDDSALFTLKESPVNPFNLTSSPVFDEETALFSTELGWNKDHRNFPPLPYRYEVVVDEKKAGESKSNELLVGNLNGGSHMATVQGLTPGGLRTEAVRINFDLVYPASDFRIVVLADNESTPPVEGAMVMLKSENGDLLVSALTDADGVASFPELASGNYSLYALMPERYLNELALSPVAHAYRDEFTALMEERLFSPADVSVNIVPLSDGLYAAELSWTTNEVSGPFNDYLFSLFLDDEWIGETSESNFCIEDLHEGNYVVTIAPVTFFGGRPEPVTFEFSIGSTNGVSAIEVAEEGCVYFDLNGVQIESSNLRPGIYIRKKPDGSVEKIRIR